MKTYADFEIDVRGRTHGNVKTLCPKCSHERRNRKDQCLSVDLDKAVWNCHHCGWAGHLGTVDNAAYSAPRRTYATPAPETATGFLDSEGAFWLRSRGIERATATEARLISVNHELKFPYYLDGVLVNVKTRHIHEKRFRMEKDARLIWYGLDWCRDADTVYIVEGEIDALSLRQAGYQAVLSCPNGAPPLGTKPNLDYFESGIHVFERAKRVVLCGDADGPGQALIAELVRRIGVEKCARVEWDEGVKDANECLTKAGVEYLRACIDEAQPYPIAGIIEPEDELHAVLNLWRNGLPRGIPTGYPSLDNSFSVVPGYFTVVTGIPGSGKSEFLDNLAINISRSHGWRWTVFSPEGAPTAAHMGRVMEKYWGKPFLPSDSKHYVATQRMTESEVMSAAGWVNDHFRWLVPEEPTIDEVLRLARIDVARRGTQGLIIDPWNEIIHHRPSGVREDEYLSEQLRKVRQFAERHAVHVFIVNHPHAIQWDQKENQYPVVKGYDLNGGAMWLNKTAALISVWRNVQDQHAPVDVWVLKTKTRQIGQRGVARLYFQRPTGRYEDANQWEPMG